MPALSTRNSPLAWETSFGQCCLRWWVCTTCSRIAFIAVAISFLALWLVAEAVSQDTDQFWIPACCAWDPSEPSELWVYEPTDYTFTNFSTKTFSLSDKTHLSESIRSFSSQPSSTLQWEACPPDEPRAGWLTCWGNGTYFNAREPERSSYRLAVRTFKFFVAGAMMGTSPFLLGVAFIVCCIPCRTDMEKHHDDPFY